MHAKLLLLVGGLAMNTCQASETRNPAEAGLRATDIICQQGNHLKGQKSLYLQQHAHNPVDWYA